MEITKNKYRILHIIGSLEIGGTEKWLVKLIRYWNKDIFEPIVIAFNDGPLKDELLDLGIKPIIMEKGKGHHLRFLYQLLSKYNQLKPDLIHCRNAYPVVIYGGISAKIAHLPLVVSIHGRPPLDKNMDTRFWYKLQSYSSRVIAVSNDIKYAITSMGGVDPDKVTVIHNGIDATQIKQNINENKRKELKIGSSEIVIGCVGTLKTVKGHEYLIKAMSLVLKQFSNACLVLVGDGPLRKQLEELSYEYNIKDKVIFLGCRNDVYELMNVFDIFALPSLSEGLCNAVLEAMAAGKPVVATNVGGNPELVGDGETGILVPPSNFQLLADAIVTLINNKQKRCEMGNLGFLKIEKEFQIRKTIEEYEKVYINVINGR